MFVICCGIGFFSCAIAYDFAQKNTDGAWIYYNIINDSTVTFACDNDNYGDSALIYIDTLHLPERIMYNSVSYSVQYNGGFYAPTRVRPKVIFIPVSCVDIPYGLNMVFVTEDRLHFNGRDSIPLNSVISYEVAEDNPRFISNSGVIYSRNGDTLALFPSGRCGIFDIPQNVSILGDYCFSFTALDTLNIGDNIVEIGENMMMMALNMRSFRYPNTIKRIEKKHSIWGYNLEEIIYGSGTEYVFGYVGQSKYLNRITCLATTPPEVGFDKIYGSDTLALYVPRKSIDLYRQAKGWNSFYAIRPVEPPVVAGVNSAEISWVTNADASGYTLTLYLDAAYTQRMVTLTFDKSGYLTNMDFNQEQNNGLSEMPDRVRQVLDDYEDNTNQEYHSYLSFTVTGLKANSSYYYVRQTLNGTEVIDEETGSFETLSDGTTGMDNHESGLSAPQKFIENGQVLIRSGNATYNMEGKSIGK